MFKDLEEEGDFMNVQPSISYSNILQYGFPNPIPLDDDLETSDFQSNFDSLDIEILEKNTI